MLTERIAAALEPLSPAAPGPVELTLAAAEFGWLPDTQEPWLRPVVPA